MKPLYEIGNDLLCLNDLLDAVDGDLSRHAEGETELTAYLEQIEADQGVKLDNYLGLISQLEMEEQECLEQKQEWYEREKQRAKRVQQLKDALLTHLQRTGQKSARTASGKLVTVVANGGQVPVVVDPVEPTELPEQYQAVIVKPAIVPIRKALEAGIVLPWARLGERGNHLRVR